MPVDESLESRFVTPVCKSLEKLCVRPTDHRPLVHQSTEPAGRVGFESTAPWVPFPSPKITRLSATV